MGAHNGSSFPTYWLQETTINPGSSTQLRNQKTIWDQRKKFRIGKKLSKK